MTRAVVIGSGMAGLCAAAFLAREGCRVEVFEQADHIGGVTATIERNGYRWDLGPMALEGFGPGEPADRVLAELGCNRDYELIPADARLLKLITEPGRTVHLEYRPKPRVRVLEEQFAVDDYPVRGLRAGGLRLSAKEVQSVRVS